MNLTYKSCKVYIHISDNVIWYEEGVLYCPLHKYFDETVQKCSLWASKYIFALTEERKITKIMYMSARNMY